MPDLDNVDSELRQVSIVRRVIQDDGGHPTTAVADQLLDECNALTREP
jgi:hypothetical protein